MPSRQPRAILAALTPEAKAALGDDELAISVFPFRLGRDSRRPPRTAPRTLADRRRSTGPRTNEVYLPESGEPYQVSREHLQIQHNGTRFVLVDRQSANGTIVEGTTLGGQQRGGAAHLNDGDVIIVGSSRSPYVFKFRVK